MTALPAPAPNPDDTGDASPFAGPSRRALLVAAAGAAGALILGPGGALAQTFTSKPRDQSLFRIATGTTSGTYYPLGGVIANAISNPPGTRPCEKGGSCGVPGLIAVAQATNGSVENVALLKAATAEAAMVQADVAWWAYTGAGVFKGAVPFESLRTLGTLYVETIHIVAAGGSGIQRMEDLRGKRVSLGEEGSGTLVDAREMLAAFQMSESDVIASHLKPAAAADQLAEGELDAFFIVAGVPITAVRDLAARVPITLLPIEDLERKRLRETRRFFVDSIIPADAYEGVPVTPALGVGAELMVRADADPELIYQIVRALWHERTRAMLAEAHARGRAIDPLGAVAGVSVPLHPGAARYYREAGLMGVAGDDLGGGATP